MTNDAQRQPPFGYTPLEERANILSHGAGAVVALVCGTILVVAAAQAGWWPQAVSALAYAVTLVGLFTASTLYHAATDAARRRRLKTLDHCAIYLLIAGTYTPYSLVALQGVWGWSLFAIIWTLAIAGLVFKLFYTGRFKALSTAIYVIMGWVGLVAIVPLIKALSTFSLTWLLVGGGLYTVGALFYLIPIPFAHAIFHLFVIAGAASQYVSMWPFITI